VTKRIYGIAYNYGEVQEKDRAQIWFDKPLSSVIFDGEPLRLPAHFDSIAHEVELGLVVGMSGKDIKPQNALKHIQACFLAIDFTNRGLGAQFKKDGAPWCLYKGSDGFTAVSDFVQLEELRDLGKIQLQLSVNN
jgi:2-keto-4-pentenoate hydratase/2-oxohepta-3-ene-1,7-dioic acid hydratase in catechol pathway